MNEVSFSTLLAREELLDHVRHPRNRGEIAGADIVHEEANPLCGDMVTIFAKLEAGNVRHGTVNAGKGTQSTFRITRCAFTGHGCMISQAAASLLTEAVRGKTTEEISRMAQPDIEALIGGTPSPSRVKCALLPLVALQNGIATASGQGLAAAVASSRRSSSQ